MIAWGLGGVDEMGDDGEAMAAISAAPMPVALKLIHMSDNVHA